MTDDPKPRINKEPITSGDPDERDLCPSCRAALPDKNTLVCLECGYDIKANKKVSTRLETVEIEEKTEFCREARVPWQALAGAGGFCVLVSMALAWGRTPEDGNSLLVALQVLVYALVHCGLGVVALITTAMLMQQRVGRIEFGVGWMACAVGIFFLAIEAGHMLGAGASAQWIVGRVLGVGLYAGVLWFGLRVVRDVLLLIAGMQFVFWLILWAYAGLHSVSAGAG
ncbi:MAG: hypothetical protein ACYTF7_03060 [Planctomycetota bacterium]|jgi:hypothetical protein